MNLSASPVPAELKTLLSGSVDLCRLSLTIGLSADTVAANQKAAFVQIGLDDATAQAATDNIMARAQKGFVFDPARAETIKRMMQAQTDALIDAKNGK